MSGARVIALGVRAMGRYKLRSGFMMLGSLVGVAGLTLVVSIGQGVEAKFLTTVGQILGNSGMIVLGGGSRLMGSPRADLGRLTVDDIAAIARAVPEVETWDPQQDLSMAVKYRDASATVRVLGDTERAEQVWGRSVTEGRFFDATEVASSARVALIGRTAARTLFGSDSPIDAEVRVGPVPFRIIGLLEPYGVDMHGMDRDNELVVPLSTLSRRLTNTDGIAMAKLVIRDPARPADVAREVARVLRARHGLTDAQPDDFRVISAVEVQKNLQMMRRVFFLYVPLVAAVALVVGGVVSAALMLSSINARIPEIGLRRAVGARPEDIRLQFLVETGAATVIGGIAGVLLGYGGATAISAHLHLGDVFSWTAVAIGLGGAAATGLLAGVVPARRAALLQPADALR